MIKNELIQIESDDEVVVSSVVVVVVVVVSVSQPTLNAPGHRPSSAPQEMSKVTRSTMMISPSEQLISSSSPSILHSLVEVEYGKVKYLIITNVFTPALSAVVIDA